MSLVQIFSKTSDSNNYIDCSFRLSQGKNLMNLEFYFINVKIAGDVLQTKKAEARSYMIVRLPQQHITEQSFDNTSGTLEASWVAVTRISGYSYLAFEILYQQIKELKISEEAFLNWNEVNDYKLQVFEKDIDIQIFEYSLNEYPFPYIKIPSSASSGEPIVKYEYLLDKFPKSTNGNPVTVLEIPYRLFLCPRVPDVNDNLGERIMLDYQWSFSNADHHMWKVDLEVKGDNSNIPRKLELMMVGSPDYPKADESADALFLLNVGEKEVSKALPQAKDRSNLVDLYIKFKLLARTQKLTFTALGISTFIEFKNTRIEETTSNNNKNNLYGWKQLISFGRDEEVTVVRLILDKETGLKMLHVQTEKRKTMKGVSYKDYRQYIMPLDEFISYESHISSSAGASGFISDDRNKFSSPFKRISFVEKKPKRIYPLTDTTVYQLDQKAKRLVPTGEIVFYYPQSLEKEYITFEFEGLDWHDNKVRFQKRIQAISAEVNNLTDASIQVLTAANNFFDEVNEKVNRIDFHRKKIGYAVKDALTKNNGEAQSYLQTSSFLLSGKLKVLGNKIDFFDPYASMPSLKEADIYIDTITKIVGKDFPVKIEFAEDYLKSQNKASTDPSDKNLRELVEDGNPAKVFVKLKESSHKEISLAIRSLAAETGGFITPELPGDFLTYLKAPNKILPEVIPRELQDNKENILNNYDSLFLIGDAARKDWIDIGKISPAKYFEGLGAKLLGDINLADILDIDFELPRVVQYPDRVVYNFMTNKIKDYEAGSVKFYGSKESVLQLFFEKQTHDKKSYQSFSRLAKFSIGVFFDETEIIKIEFKELKTHSAHNKPSKTDISIDKVNFGGKLKFLAKLAESFTKMDETGLRIYPSLNNIEFGYTFLLPTISSPSFNFSNLKFDFSLNIPLPKASDSASIPITTKFSVNNPDDKFLISAGIFGGRGHFSIENTTNSLVAIDASLEFGGYFGINLGIAKGYVFLFAGIRYQYQAGKAYSVDAYLICEGGVTVFGFISVYVTFIMKMTYVSAGNYLEGSAAVRYSFRIGFFKKSFTLRYRKRIAGTDSRSGFATKSLESIYSNGLWEQYRNSFSLQ